MLSQVVSEAAAKFAASDPKFLAWTDAQMAAFGIWAEQDAQRLLLFYPTGKGKTKTALTMLQGRGYSEIIVIAPPKTHPAWKADAAVLGLDIILYSHQKFRMADTKLKRDVPIIVDEMHMLGGNNKIGFKKLDRMALKFPAIILCSATPNYNDAERCYCIGHILDTINNMGGFLNWVKERCVTTPNYYATMPIVEGLIGYEGAADYLSQLSYCAYIPDEAEWIPIDLPVHGGSEQLVVFDDYGYDARHHRIMASQIEAMHHRKRLMMLDDEEQFLRPAFERELLAHMQASPSRKFLIYSTDKVVAQATHRTMLKSKYISGLITGDSDNIEKKRLIFVHFDGPAVLIGTAALATGIDGIDAVCDHLIELDPTTDAAMRRQLIGRVLPRGTLVRDTIVTTVVTVE